VSNILDIDDMDSTPVVPLYPLLYESTVRAALLEDLGRAGDWTTDAVVPMDLRCRARLLAREPGRIAGLEVCASAFRLLDPRIEVAFLSRDGDDAAAGASLAVLEGPARPILSAERTALNLLGRLCGIATATRGIVQAIRGTRARVVCTRKTTPGLRALEKYAVRAGGGVNHRFGLDDGVLIKDNHRVLAGGVAHAIERVRRLVGHMVKIEVEVDTLAELAEALECHPDAILLDNMRPATLAEAVGLSGGRALIEASGGIGPDNARAVAATGVDLISLGWITHSPPQLDVAMDVEMPGS